MNFFENNELTNSRKLAVLDNFVLEPDKYVYSFSIKEKSKIRNMLTYNKGAFYGELLRSAHNLVVDLFNENFCERNENSFAYHKGVCCKDAIQSHLKSNYFIKLDIHHFFESITEEVFFDIYKDRFNKKWRNILKGCFYKRSLCIGFVTSPVISDFFMSKFDNTISDYIAQNPSLHYSRYSDDILLSSEEDDDESLNELFELVKEELSNLKLSVNEKKTKKIKLDYNLHNSISFLGLNISKQDEVNNKITISKNYILFLLYLIEKNNKYENRCKGLLDEINSRVAYLAYNSPVSFQKFQTKHIRKFGMSYNFVPKKPMNRYYADKTDEIYNWDEYVKDFEIDIHTKVVDSDTKEVILYDSIQLVKYLGNDEEVIIPPFVDSIADNAFMGKTMIKKVVLNNKVRYIGKYAFCRCSNLETIEFPKTLKFIGTAAFQNCNSLKNIVVPSKVKTIFANTFASSGLENVTFEEGLKEIKQYAFAGTNIKSLVLPNTIETLGTYAFEKCIYLNDIKFSDNLLSIPMCCFNDCRSITSLDFSGSLLSIEYGAFTNCSKLEKLYIPKNIINISSGAFRKCNSLKYIEVDKDNLVFDSRENCNALIDTGTNKLIIATQNTKIVEGIEIIGSSAFENFLVTNIILPNSLKKIESNAFSGCYLLKEINFPDNITEIGSSAFQNCISLTNVKLPNSLSTIESNLFRNCDKLESVKLPEKLTVIKKHAFNGASALLKIDFSDSLKKIEYKAFANCYSLKKIHIPASLLIIKPYAFSGCSKNLEKITVDKFNTSYDSRENSNAIIETKRSKLILGCKNTIVKDGVKEIDDFAFAYCKDLQSIDLPKSLVSIGKYAFVDCQSLIAIDLNCVNKLANNCFANCNSLVSVNFPNSLVSIGENTFRNCTNLKDLILPDSAVNISKSAFSGCISIENIYIPKTFKDFDLAYFKDCYLVKKIVVDSKNPYYDSRNDANAIIWTDKNKLLYGCSNTIIPDTVESIADYAFYSAELLNEILIPKSVTYIGEGAFSNCENLEKVILPNNNLTLGNGVFSFCPNLKEINLPDNLTTIPENTFWGDILLSKIEFPEKLKSISKNAFNSTGIIKIDLPNNTSIIGSHAFANCQQLESVVIPKQHFWLDDYAFENCTSLKFVKLPSGIKKIYRNTFKNCTNLTQIELPNSLTEINTCAFENCNSLRQINLPESLTTVGDYAFANCKSLVKMNLPEKLKSVGTKAFYNCISLVEANLPEKLKTIESKAFAGTSLTSVRIPASVNSFFNDAFENCEKLSTVEVHEDNKILTCKNNMLFEIKTNTLLYSFNSTCIPDDTVIIAEKAFAGRSDIKEIVIPDSVMSINDRAFYNCPNLEKITLSCNLISLGESAFENCPKLKEIIISNKIMNIGESCFKDCTGLEKVLFEEPETKCDISYDEFMQMKNDNKDALLIKIGAFENCISLVDLHLPNRFTSLGNFSFKNCTSLKNIYISRYVINIGTHAFYNCSNSLEKITVCDNNEFYDSRENCNAIIRKYDDTLILGCMNTIIPNSVKCVGHSAFINNLGLQKIDLPDSVLLISDSAFSNCKNVKNINVPLSVLEIKKSAFEACESVENINVHKDNLVYKSVNNCIIEIDNKDLICGFKKSIIPDDVLTINDNAFCGIKNVYIPKNIINISNTAFNNCTNLENITVDKDNPYYDSRENCNAIIDTKNNQIIKASLNTKIIEGIKSIGRFAFKGLDIKNLFIPKTVQYIEKGAFYCCNSIETIIVDKDNKVYCSNDANVIVSTKTNKLFLSCKNSIINDDVILHEDCEHDNYNLIDSYYYAHDKNKFTDVKTYKERILKGLVNNRRFEYKASSIDLLKRSDVTFKAYDDDPFSTFGDYVSVEDDELPF